tara:strand:- start:163 stop:360 length:198 start_codon:yes stop_codon:yes gene_type:complete
MREQKLIASRGTGVGFAVHVSPRPGSSELCCSLLKRVAPWQGFCFCLWTSSWLLLTLPLEGNFAC